MYTTALWCNYPLTLDLAVFLFPLLQGSQLLGGGDMIEIFCSGLSTPKSLVYKLTGVGLCINNFLVQKEVSLMRTGRCITA